MLNYACLRSMILYLRSVKTVILHLRSVIIVILHIVVYHHEKHEGLFNKVAPGGSSIEQGLAPQRIMPAMPQGRPVPTGSVLPDGSSGSQEQETAPQDAMK